MRLIVTRVAPQAQAWAQALTERGLPAVAYPLMEIAPSSDTRAMQQAWQNLHDYAACMWVSAAAVEHGFALRPESNWPSTPRFWATGPGTVQALKQAGVPDTLIDAPTAQFDSETLWQQVAQQRAWPGQRVLIVRGADIHGEPQGRDWLAQQLRSAGAQVDEVSAYERRCPAWTPEQKAWLQAAAQDGSVWLISSSMALAHAPAIDFTQARAIATHPRIAQAAQEAGFASVHLAQPTLDDIVRVARSIE